MKQQGFTLIELIIVIVILGILAVTAAPKFIDIQSDATASTLQGAKAALKGGAQLVYAKSAIAGEQSTANANDATTQVTIGGVTIETDFGYPDAELMTDAMLAGWVDLPTSEWTLTVGNGDTDTPDAGEFGISPGTTTPDYQTDTCHVIYSEAGSAGAAPTVTVVSGGC